jgi:hypothetical protein
VPFSTTTPSRFSKARIVQLRPFRCHIYILVIHQYDTINMLVDEMKTHLLFLGLVKSSGIDRAAFGVIEIGLSPGILASNVFSNFLNARCTALTLLLSRV